MAKSVHQQRVEDFMALAKQETPAVPVLPCEEIRFLRAQLILEEALETIDALGFRVLPNGGIATRDGEVDLVQIADGCADVIVVATGTLSACGMHDVEIQEEVDKNNLSKFGPGHSWSAFGKLVKPPGHVGPDLKGVLTLMRERALVRLRRSV